MQPLIDALARPRTQACRTRKPAARVTVPPHAPSRHGATRFRRERSRALIAFESAQDPDDRCRGRGDRRRRARARGDAALARVHARASTGSPRASVAALEIPARGDARRVRIAAGRAARRADAGAPRACAPITSGRRRRLELTRGRRHASSDSAVTPLDRVGIYVPGGKAAYPSSVLMNAIPRKSPACARS